MEDAKLITLHGLFLFISYAIFVAGLVNLIVKLQNKSSKPIYFSIIKIIIGLIGIIWFLFMWG